MNKLNNIQPVNNNVIAHIIDDILKQLENKFTLRQDRKINIKYGSELKKENKKLYSTALKASLKDIATEFNLNSPTKYKTINDNATYLLIFKPDNKNKKDYLYYLIPFGANLVQFLAGVFIQNTNKQSKENVKKYMTKLTSAFLQNLTVGQALQYYQPKKKSKKIPKEFFKNINFQSLKNDSFNIAINMNLNINDVYEPLKNAIKAKDAKPNYQKVAPTPMHYLNYDNSNKKQIVHIGLTFY